jgi:hypothetical protein
MRFVQRADGGAAIADDMPPATRAVLFLLEHANGRRDGGLPLPCPCGECTKHRASVRAVVLPDGSLAVEDA